MVSVPPTWYEFLSKLQVRLGWVWEVWQVWNCAQFLVLRHVS